MAPHCKALQADQMLIWIHSRGHSEIHHERKTASPTRSCFVLSAKAQCFSLVIHFECTSSFWWKLALCLSSAASHTECRFLSLLHVTETKLHLSWHPLFLSHLVCSVFTSFIQLLFISLACVVSCFFFFPSISAIIAFHPRRITDGNNLILLLQADTILLWLIEVPSESQRKRRSSLSHSLTGNPLYCFIDRRQ